MQRFEKMCLKSRYREVHFMVLYTPKKMFMDRFLVKHFHLKVIFEFALTLFTIPKTDHIGYFSNHRTYHVTIKGQLHRKKKKKIMENFLS